jgi:dihydrofolate reductase
VAHVVYYAAASLDGRIAGPNDDLSFLQTLAGGPGMYGYDEFLAEIDSLIMGAASWRFMVRHGSWPYRDRPTWVLTHAPTLEALEGADAMPHAGDVRDVVRAIDERGLRRTWLVGGGNVAGQLLAADLLDELIVTLAPTFVGRGPALADGDFPLRSFTLTDVRRFEGSDGVQLRYERRE